MFLGININFVNKNEVTLDQKHYINEMLNTFRFTEEAKGLTTVLNPDYNIMKEGPLFDEHIFRQATGTFSHLGNNTRPDIAVAVSALCQKNNNPTRKDWVNAKHLMRYLKQTQDFVIKYKKTEKPLETYVDSNWSAFRSTTGYVIRLAGAPITWKRQKQQLTAQCFNDAEYIAPCECAKAVIYLKGLLREINFPEYAISPSIIKIDNQGAIKKAEGQTNTERSKYIDNKYHFIQEEIQRRRVKLEYVRSAKNHADIFTKLLSGKKTESFVKKVGFVVQTSNK
ncbi:hypothetical protein FOCC_FOCC014187 [Frankliniella occidentalis]|nr:hypothetical protein FOCC_FOCC014187 [Frankliniella occidentalis]